jgi:hypothetical protein
MVIFLVVLDVGLDVDTGNLLLLLDFCIINMEV